MVLELAIVMDHKRRNGVIHALSFMSICPVDDFTATATTISFVPGERVMPSVPSATERATLKSVYP